MDDLRTQLAKYRARFQLDAIVLFTVSAEEDHHPIVVDSCAEARIDELATLTPRLLDDKIFSSITEAAFSTTSDDRRHTWFVQLARALTDDSSFSGTLYSPGDMHSHQPVRPVVLTLWTDSPGSLPEDRHLELLCSMLVTTVQVRQAIDSAALSPLDMRLLIPEIDEDGVVDLRRMTKRAVRYGRRHSYSDVAAIHWRGRPDDTSSPDDVAGILTEIDPGRSPHELLDEMYQISFAKQYRGAGCVALACPIPGVLAGPHTPAAGVLLLCRSGSEPFSSHLINMGRAICIRLAVIRATVASGEVARIISQLSDLTPPRTEYPADVPPPSDREIALAGLQSALKQVVANTNSHSATVRLVRCRAGGSGTYGLALEKVVEFVVHGTESEHDLTLQPVTDNGGVNVRVAISGRHVYSPDVSKEPGYFRARPATRSQLCMPVRTTGHLLIGTLNLESASPANYGTYLPYVRAVSDAIGRRFATAGLIASEPVAERAAQVLGRTHTYESRLVTLRKHAHELPLSAGDQDRIDGYVQECLDLINVAIRPTPAPSAVQMEQSLGEVLQRALHERSVLDLNVKNDWRRLSAFTTPWPVYSAQIVHTAARTVLSNMKNHASAIYNRSAPTVRYGECTWDGLLHAVVTFTNATDRILAPEVARQVYQIPIARAGELRLGAHLAGAQLRNIGGWIAFDVDTSGLARTVLLVPADPSQKGLDR